MRNLAFMPAPTMQIIQGSHWQRIFLVCNMKIPELVLNAVSALQIWRASPNATFPTFRLPGLNADPDSYRLVPCARSNITMCIYTGDAACVSASGLDFQGG